MDLPELPELKGKKLLVLAGAAVHRKVVRTAKELGVYTIVTDFLKPTDAPAKQIADEYWMLDIKDVDAIVERCKERHVDGVLAYCIDPAQKPYQQITERLSLPCYGNADQFELMNNKRMFKDYCRAHGVDVVQEYSLTDVDADRAIFPVLVKPTDSRGSRGQTVCHSSEEVHSAIARAQHESTDGSFLIERFMHGCRDLAIAYIVINGEPYLLKCGDRFLGDLVDGLERQQISTLLPSSHISEYLAGPHQNVCKMIKALGVKFATVFLQGFLEGGKVYMYDPGLRLPGSDFDVPFRETTGFDSVATCIRFALTGDVSSCVGNPEGAFNYNGGACVILSIAVRPGKIAAYEGFDVIASDPRVFSANILRTEGDVVEATGDVRQRVVEFVAFVERRDEVRNFYSFVYNNFKVLDEDGVDMSVSRVCLDDIGA